MPPSLLAWSAVGSSGCGCLDRATTCVRSAAHEQNIAVDDTAVTHDGRVELPCWVREQAISRTVHRHGRIPS